MRRRRIFVTSLLCGVVQSLSAGEYQSVLLCSGHSSDRTTGAPVTVELTIVPAERTDRPLWVGEVPDYLSGPLTLGVGLGAVTWDDGAFGVRRDRALQLTQPGDDKGRYAPIEMPLVVLGFRASPSGSIPLLVQVEVHRDGLPFKAWLPGHSELLAGECVERPQPSG